MALSQGLATILLGGTAVATVVGAQSGSAELLLGSLLIAAPVAGEDGLGSLLTWLVGGSLLGAVIGYLGAMVLPVPLAATAAAGLGVALGGGAGVLSRSVSGADPTPPDAVTVSMEREADPAPEPADLFENHPDPLVYVIDEGNGPVVRAANPAFEATFELPMAALTGTPLAETLRMDNAESVADAVGAGRDLGDRQECETAEGPRQFRLRWVGGETDGYLLFTAADQRG
jgi:hypothetical protein